MLLKDYLNISTIKSRFILIHSPQVNPAQRQTATQRLGPAVLGVVPAEHRQTSSSASLIDRALRNHSLLCSPSSLTARPFRGDSHDKGNERSLSILVFKSQGQGRKGRTKMFEDFKKRGNSLLLPLPPLASPPAPIHTHGKNDGETRIDFGGSWRKGLW